MPCAAALLCCCLAEPVSVRICLHAAAAGFFGGTERICCESALHVISSSEDRPVVSDECNYRRALLKIEYKRCSSQKCLGHKTNLQRHIAAVYALPSMTTTTIIIITTTIFFRFPAHDELGMCSW